MGFLREASRIIKKVIGCALLIREPEVRPSDLIFSEPYPKSKDGSGDC